jgi:hypothetical protein
MFFRFLGKKALFLTRFGCFLLIFCKKQPILKKCKWVKSQQQLQL